MVAEWISLRAFAERRGVSLAAVQKAIGTNRVTAVQRDAKGRLSAIEFHAAMAQWDGNTDPVEAARSGQAPSAGQMPDLVAAAPAAAATVAAPAPDTAPPADAAAQPGADAAVPGPDAAADPAAPPGANADYLLHRAATEKYKSAREEMEFFRDAGKLVDRVAVEQAIFKRNRTLREQLMNIPDRLAAQLAAEREPARVHDAITRELKRVLHELASDPLADQPAAAGGPGGS